jgi:hypothetical protein
MVAVSFSLVSLSSGLTVPQVHAVPFPNRGRTSAMSYSATEAERIARFLLSEGRGAHPA